MKIIDLTKTLYEGMPVYPGDPEVHITTTHTYDSHSWLLRTLSLGSHTGTHVDAPAHMHENGDNLDDLPAERFIGKSKVVRLQDTFPIERGLFFIEEATLQDAHKIIASQPLFVGGNITEPLERELLRQGIITYTHLVNLEQLTDEFLFIGLPLKIAQGDGSPIRAIAMINEVDK